MVTINRKVIDISHLNNVTSWSAIKSAGIIGVIHKATEGMTFVDNLYTTRKPHAIAAGLKWGAYHFCNGSNVQRQVDNFLSVTGEDPDILYAIDWEDVAGNTMNLDEVRQILTLIEARIG